MVHLFNISTVIVLDAGENGADDGESYTLYQTLYAYHSDDPEDLHFEANEILQVTDDGDGTEHTWFYGRRQDGKQGHFPGNASVL